VNSRYSGRRTWGIRRPSYGYTVGRGPFRIPLKWWLYYVFGLAALGWLYEALAWWWRGL